MLSAYEKGIMANYRTGTAFPNLDINGVLLNLKIVLPPLDLAIIFESIFQSQNRVDLISNSESLRKLRTILLDKLVTGKLKITDIEKMVEEVGI